MAPRSTSGRAASLTIRCPTGISKTRSGLGCLVCPPLRRLPAPRWCTRRSRSSAAARSARGCLSSSRLCSSRRSRRACSSHRSRAGWLLTITVAGVYILWHAYYVGNERPATDLAESAGTDTLTVALWMAGVHELLRGSTRVGVTSVALSALTTMMGPPLAVLTMPVMWLVNADRARRTWRWAAMAGAVLVPAVAVVVWITGVGPDWWVGFNREFIRDLATAETRAPEWPLVVRLLISTAGLPLLAPLFWRRMTGTSRAFTLVGHRVSRHRARGTTKDPALPGPSPMGLPHPRARTGDNPCDRVGSRHADRCLRPFVALPAPGAA
jgi:hypothetical protein